MLALIGGAAFGSFFWMGLTPEEQHHILHKARSGDVEGFAITVRFKANEKRDRHKRKAAEKLKEVTDDLFDAAAEQVKKSAHEAALEAKAKLGDKIEGQLGVQRKGARDAGAAAAR